MSMVVNIYNLSHSESGGRRIKSLRPVLVEKIDPVSKTSRQKISKGLEA
jgi:hypothetical protein